MKYIHLICNAHIDPVWLWEREEGIAEAISTFRVAAEFCEQYDGFVFNHNESVLYQWIEEYEPQLFKRIQKLVQKKKWHIMGGWYLQPDCNMPSGESIMRHIEMGRRYFKQKFNIVPTTATNFDPFGHSRGLVQILKLNGYDSYVFCRPDQTGCPLPADAFNWVGYDGSEIKAFRSFKGYCTSRGGAAQRIQEYSEKGFDGETGLLLWGIGNHGGGPSREDLETINALRIDNCQVLHSTPEAYFQTIDIKKLPRHESDLNPWAVGCYTSQICIKQLHRELENQQFMTETMALHAHITSGMLYPEVELNDSLQDLLFNQFHDILPGTSIKSAEAAALRHMNHGLEILTRIRTKAFLRLCKGQAKAKENHIPIMVYNPHPFEVQTIIECEYQLASQSKDENYITNAIVYQNDLQILSQLEKEKSNLPFDWRKRIVFMTTLAPSCINRFDCKLVRTSPVKSFTKELFVKSLDAEIKVDEKTGLLCKYFVDGKDLLGSRAFLPTVYDTDEDPWGMNIKRIDKKIAELTLCKSPHVIEDGDVRKIVESEFFYKNSRVILQYILPKKGALVEVRVTAQWVEESTVLKLEIPINIKSGNYYGETVFGFASLLQNGDEAVCQRFSVYKNNTDGISIFNNGTYGSHCENGKVSLTLLRTACYSAHPYENREFIPQDRCMPHIDIGERYYVFHILPYDESVYHQAAVLSQRPYALSFFSSGSEAPPNQLFEISDKTVQVSAFFKQNNNLILRLFETTGKIRTIYINVLPLNITQEICLKAHEIKSITIALPSE